MEEHRTQTARQMDLTVFAQTENLGVMQQAAVRSWVKHLRPIPTHATAQQWRLWLREALTAVVTS
jgi:hypothetical protein